MLINPHSLPDFDMLICQTFSIAGKREGMQDDRGKIIYGLINILKSKKVKYFILENVKGLLNHNNGQSLNTILTELKNAGYKVFYKLLDSNNYGIPQMRERVYFIGFHQDTINHNFSYTFPEKITEPLSIESFLIDTIDNNIEQDSKIYATFLKYLSNKYNLGKHDIHSIKQKEYLVLDTRQSDLRLYNNKIPTLRAGRHGILYIKNSMIRKLTGFEALLLQGFTKNMAIKASLGMENTNLLAQAGNAMTVNVIQQLSKSMIESLKNA
jgi:DNA (cytosine-5)-methyltransferase 1